MTKLELLRIVVGRARANGFEFRRWYVTRLGLPWISTDAAITALDAQRRYYALLFSHEFARSFWKPGEEITFTIAASSFERIMPDGSVGHVNRKPYIRRSARRDAWRYHLQQMALAEEPLRYIRKYLHVAEEVEDDEIPEIAAIAAIAEVQAFSTPELEETAAEPHPKVAVMPQPAVEPLPHARIAHHAPKLQIAHAKTASPRSSAAKPMPRPLPTDLPHFLRRNPQTN